MLSCIEHVSVVDRMSKISMLATCDFLCFWFFEKNGKHFVLAISSLMWIWFLNQLEGEEVQRKAKRHIERERGRKEATADMSEDLSEGERGDVHGEILSHGGSVRGRMPRISSVDVMENWAKQHKEKKLYIVLIRHELQFIKI